MKFYMYMRSTPSLLIEYNSKSIKNNQNDFTRAKRPEYKAENSKLVPNHYNLHARVFRINY